MYSIRFSKLRTAVAGLSLTFAAGGCALLEPTAENYDAPQIGATWVNARTDTGSFGTGRVEQKGGRGERTWEGQKVLTFEGTDGQILAQPNGNWIAIVKGDTPIMTWDPPLHWQWPLKVGKTWTRDQRVTFHANKRTLPYQLTQKVEAYENVTVPAGTFKTFRVSTVTTLGDETTVWFSPQLGIFVKQSLRRTAKHPAGAGTRDFELVSHTIKK